MGSKEILLKKIQKAVLRSSVVMLSLFAVTVVGSGVAQAQECIARAKSVMARVEGLTEDVGTIELRCAEPMGLGFGSPEVLEITVELNARITSVIDDERVVADLLYTEVAGSGVSATNFSDPQGMGAKAATLSADGSTITWKILSANVNLGGTNDGFQVTIGGIKANTSTVEAGEDVTAVVSVGGGVVHSGSLKVADVSTGLIVKVAKANVLQCETDAESETATVTIQEGFVNSIMDTNEFMVSFIGIPEGVTVTVPEMVGVPMIDDPDNGMIPDPAAIGLTLKPSTARDRGVTVDEGVGTVALSMTGSGAVVYEVVDGTTGAGVKDEWVKLTVTFKWKSGDVIDTGEVAVSFAPVSTMGGDTFADDGAPAERYAASGAHTVIDVSPCRTTMLFPYVSAGGGYYTGIAITNTSAQSGSCTATFIGEDAPAPEESPEVESERQWVFLMTDVFQGYLTVDCNFQKGKGFAFIGNDDLSLAHGYLAEDMTK